ncbi:methyltransferase domain-containing protein [Parvularcula dongshanensis]|uniref:SAM-dependent methyltransferase n=1 Tax=Parvularcula dongshanensis TaxID=1173995 RepID=A0A840I1N3_9PROT|nr:SAM-dependent methyltransferase [Parvularcula dongshanensis]
MTRDRSNGWDAVAAGFLAARTPVGLGVVRRWAASLPPGCAVLDLGAGSGEPLAAALIAEGFDLHAVDASPAMVAAFRERFPDAAAACEPVEASAFFGRTFGGILAVGLIFLLPTDVQRDVIARAATALRPGGRLIFSAPSQACSWNDVLTGRRSVSLGAERYRDLLVRAGLIPTGEDTDRGGNHYYTALRPSG